MNQRTFTHLIGIDEAGRGGVAGPVAVGAVCIRRPFRLSHFGENCDSKQLSETKRELLFKKLIEESNQGSISYAVSFTEAKSIDTHGIVHSVRKALLRAISRFPVDPDKTLVLLDGGLAAPSRFTYQRTIIRGDAKERIIGLASIVAKVSRDRKMRRLAMLYPFFDFATHKGYGTRAHFASLRLHTLTPIHRRTFLSSLDLSKGKG